MAISFTEQTGTANPFTGINVERLSAPFTQDDSSTPTFADVDGDGDLDLVVGENRGNLDFYENTGTASAPTYTVRTGTANPFNGIDAVRFSAPTFADIDGDGDLDLVVGEQNGNLDFYENTGTASAPTYTVRTGTANPWDGINVGIYSTPTFADVDGDGDLDLVVGEQFGTLRYYENTGTASAPTYTVRTGTANPWDGINVGGFSTPTFADIDGDGDLDLVVGEGEGALFYYENTGTASDPVYTVRTGTANPWDGINVGRSYTPTFADIDGDGDQDLVVGRQIGILNYYENTSTDSAPTYTERTGTANPWDGVDVGRLLHPDICGY